MALDSAHGGICCQESTHDPFAFALLTGQKRARRLRYSRGEQPTERRKSVEKDPKLWYPQAKQISVTDASVSTRRVFARSRRDSMRS